MPRHDYGGYARMADPHPSHIELEGGMTATPGRHGLDQHKIIETVEQEVGANRQRAHDERQMWYILGGLFVAYLVITRGQ